MQATVKTVEEAVAFARQVGMPLGLSSAYSLSWRKTAKNLNELRILVEEGLNLSPIKEVTIIEEEEIP